MEQKPEIETLVYKQAGKTTLYFDVYVPSDIEPDEKRPIALLIHSGGHVLFTHKEVNIKQIKFLITDGFLPVNSDYHLCPEVKILDGPMNDVCEALHWTRFELPSLAPSIAPGLQADGEKVVAVVDFEPSVKRGYSWLARFV